MKAPGEERRLDDLEARKDDIDLNEEEQEGVEDRQTTSPRVLHEVVRRSGDEELARPASSLLWSGLAAGIAISASILGQALLESKLPDAPWRPLVASLGYTLGFLIVILGRLQLFTESTLSAVIPVATHPSFGNLGRLLRLWVLVLASNLVGTLFIAWVTSAALIGSVEQHAAMLDVSRKLLEHDWFETLKLGIPAGFLIAAVPWTMPSAEGQSFWVVMIFTYAIALGGFTHSVAGSGEAWLLAIAGETTFLHAATSMILPALIGNVIGGTGLFALLAHAQVQKEL
jgi:formate/nitrite transporter FocA (FNT family)